MIFYGSVVRMVISRVMTPFILIGGANVSEMYTASVFRTQLRALSSIFVQKKLVIKCQTTRCRKKEGHWVYCIGKVHMRVIRKVSVHFDYFENRSRGRDVTGSQSEKTLLCIREQSLSRGASQSAVRHR